MGKDREGRDAVDALLGNLTTKIWHANGDPTTNEHASKTIGSSWQLKHSANRGTSSNMSQTPGGIDRDTVTNASDSENQGASVSEQLAADIEPQVFTRLRTGGAANNFESDAIVFKPGRIWKATGKNYMHVTFKQKIS